jgi:hypothetical protein
MAAGKAMTAIKWIGSALAIVGALVIALNLPFSGWGFVAFLISSVIWTIAGIMMKEPSLVVLQGTFVIINLIGIYRWLIV